MHRALLTVQDLRTVFPTRAGAVRAADGVSFELGAGETLGIVGESGSGKSVTALSLLRLVPPPGRVESGSVLLHDRDLLQASEAEMQSVRGQEIAMIFQDPTTSLNPVYRTGWQVREPLQLHRPVGGAPAREEAVRMLSRVGIPDPERRARMYPHELSGGMRQRAMIAMGLTTAPAVLIADEPTTALDVTIQAQVLDLLRHVNQEFQTAIVLITHNLGVVAGMCDRVLVMYAGRVVEEGPTADVFAHPRHPYTWALLRSMPRIDADEKEPLRVIEGQPPDLARLPSGCAFHPRCAFAADRCTAEAPSLEAFAAGEPSVRAACWETQRGLDLRAASAGGGHG
jgi:oligopeptide transport system ATP-binding protein